MSVTTKTYRTFKEWSGDGYTILKGSKATWIDGVAMFSNEQVEQRFRNHNREIGENPSEEGHGEWPDEDQWFDPLDWGDQ